MAIEKEHTVWNISSLKEHIEKLLEERHNYYEKRFTEAKEAVAIAERNAEKWRDNANEWRDAMNDKDRLLMQKAEFTTFKDGYEKVIDELKTKSDRGEGKSEGYAKFVGWILAALVIVGFIIDRILNK